MLGRYLMVDNDYLTENSHDDYYIAIDSIKAGNRWGRAGFPFVSTTWTGRHYQGTMPGWHIQFLANTFAGDGDSSFKTLVNNEDKSDYDGVVFVGGGGAEVFFDDAANLLMSLPIKTGSEITIKVETSFGMEGDGEKEYKMTVYRIGDKRLINTCNSNTPCSPRMPI